MRLSFSRGLPGYSAGLSLSMQVYWCGTGFCSLPSLWLLALLRRQSVRIGRRDLWRIFGIGGIAALHWVAFYASIKYSNVSVGLLCFSAIGFFTALVEPLVLRHRIDGVELLLGLLVIAGIFFIFRFPAPMGAAISKQRG